MVPNGWRHLKLPEFAWFQEGPGLRKWQFTDSGCKVINITNIVNGYLDLAKTERHISEEELNAKYKHFLCNAGDIVIASSGNSYCKHGIVREQDLPLVMNTSVIRFKPLDNCDYEFLNQFLKSKYLKQQIDVLITGGAQPNFGPAHLKQIELNLPPINEQRIIAKVLSTWDKAITTTEKLIATSKQQKKALMQQLLTGKKRLVNPKTGKAFEGVWEDKKLKQCVAFQNGRRKPIKQEERANIQGEIPYYGATGIIDYVNDHIFDEKLILLGEDGENILSRVLPHVFVIQGKTWVNNHAHVLKANSDIDTDFLCIYLESLDYRKYNSGSAQPKINKAVCEKIPVKLPSLQEQQKIASVLTTADKEIEVLEAKLAHFKQEKKALMQQLLTGKRRVKVDEAEAA
ncbi:restriction endonuclease subunit S [uncultured Photobacterium sp.]|uniref:restriction endonuclease subunit S n=1 Tax=uncultured Photobacterium sp. TaxID=173973 RepID=UPI0026341E18|nr:restriction endonuclease subunit S [uncultured Photobacterium sp.]